MVGHKEHANNGKVVLNKDTFTKILDINRNRTKFIICNLSVSEDVYITMCDVASATKPSGICIKTEKDRDFPRDGDTVYTGEVCGIADNGDATITFIEY